MTTTSLQVTSHLYVTPFIDICNAAFADRYTNGLKWRLVGEMKGTGPVKDIHLFNALKAWVRLGLFEEKQEERLGEYIGFYIGMIHGGVLSPTTGHLRPEITTLVTFTNQDAARGYRAGREWFFHESEPEERRYTDERPIERFRELVNEYPRFRNKKGTWNYGIGCILGELSGHFFPETRQERQAWEEECQKVLTGENEQHNKALRRVVLQER